MRADSVVRSTCPYCGVGCQVDLSVAGGRIFRVEAPFAVAPNFGRLCVKGRFGTDYVHHPGRLTAPLIRREPQAPGRRASAAGPDDWREASWDEALDLVARRLLALRDRHGPDCITANACAKASNEDNYLLQKFMRAVVGTNNIDHCTRLCHAASVVGLQMAVGSSAMSNAIAEMKDLECFIVTGSNTAENHPVIATFLKQAVRRNGARLIVIDPRETEMCRFASLWLRHRPGSDVALFTAMAHVIVGEGLYDADFVERRTEGFAEYLASLEEATPEWAEAITGVPAADIRAAARMYAGAGAAAIYWGMGISQSSHGTDNALSLINLALLCGHVGRPGTGLNPLRGQNNVQGCSDVGGIPGFYTAYRPVSDPAARADFERAWGVPLPTQTGLTTTEMVDGILTGGVRAWYVMGENPLMSEPNLNHARHALEQLEFFVAQDIFFNETNRYADVILPAAGFAEKDGTYTNSDRRIQRGRRAVEPPGLARPDWAIVADLARRALALQGRDAAGWDYPDAEAIWEELRRVTPEMYGVTYGRLEREGGVHWPCPDLDHPGSPFLFEESFPRGRAMLWPVSYSATSEQTDAEYPFALNTGRVLYHWHGGTLTRASALEQIWPECTVELHPGDAARLGLATGDWVEVASRRGAITARLLVTGRSPEGVVFIPFHFAEAAANMLTDDRLDTRAKIPDYKVCSVRVARAAAPAPGASALPLTERGAIKDPL
ncbi:MAG TPA: formate dehydrogenase subunit alpha, partial [Chloroflexaceae bacterium]|nr:formate dehydrogenase subunit alpha [Chloroflexaceae bacterium]